MDGTPGSALYRIPFRLNKRPSELWTNLFIRNWNTPPQFTSMHRPRISKVIGDKIILDGTTMEEVRDYHRETLKICVEKSNEEEMIIFAREELKRKKENERVNNHEENMRNLAEEIEF